MALSTRREPSCYTKAMKLPFVVPRKAKITGLVLLVLLVLGVIFVAWATHAAPAEQQMLKQAQDEPSVEIVMGKRSITIQPKNQSPTTGLIFYPGAKVAPEAYVAKLSAVARRANIAIVIGRPMFNLAIFSINQANDLKSALPSVTTWYIGGHSLGGAMACQYAEKHQSELAGVMLFASYCAVDISRTSLKVLSISGANDGLVTQAKLDESRSNLPENAYTVAVPGMNHAQFGDYGAQEGDGVAAVADEVAATAMSSTVANFLSPQP